MSLPIPLPGGKVMEILKPHFSLRRGVGFLLGLNVERMRRRRDLGNESKKICG
jgi:hypothetical protein